MLFSMLVTGQQILIIVLATIAVVATVGFFFRMDTRFEKKQRAYVELASTLEKFGFKHLAVICTNIAIKDVSGVIAETKKLADLMKDPKLAMEILSENFLYQLPLRLARPGDREAIFKAVDDYRVANPDKTSSVKV
jgi:hypothetical protein